MSYRTVSLRNASAFTHSLLLVIDDYLMFNYVDGGCISIRNRGNVASSLASRLRPKYRMQQQSNLRMV
jgi:hypothetical protein